MARLVEQASPLSMHLLALCLGLFAGWLLPNAMAAVPATSQPSVDVSSVLTHGRWYGMIQWLDRRRASIELVLEVRQEGGGTSLFAQHRGFALPKRVEAINEVKVAGTKLELLPTGSVFLDVPEVGEMKIRAVSEIQLFGLVVSASGERGYLILRRSDEADLNTAVVATADLPPTWEAERTFVIDRPTGVKLAGSLYLPARTGKLTCVVLIPGGRPVARESMRYDALKLAEAGLAVVAFDDRGCGQSTGQKLDTTLEESGEDVAAVVQWVGTQPEIDSKRVGLLGLSEGTYVSAAASRVPGVRINRVAWAASPSVPPNKVHARLIASSALSGCGIVLPEDSRERILVDDAALAALNAREIGWPLDLVSECRRVLATANPNVLPEASQHRIADSIAGKLHQVRSTRRDHRSWKVDPVSELEELDRLVSEVLVIIGSVDENPHCAEPKRLTEAGARLTRTRIQVLDVTHGLVDAGAPDSPTAYDPKQRLSPRVVTALVNFFTSPGPNKALDSSPQK